MNKNIAGMRVTISYVSSIMNMKICVLTGSRGDNLWPRRFPKLTNRQAPPFDAAIGPVCRGAKIGFQLSSWAQLFYSSHNGFHHFSCVPVSVTPWMPSKTSCLKVCARLITLYDDRFLCPPLSAAFQSRYEPLCLLDAFETLCQAY